MKRDKIIYIVGILLFAIGFLPVFENYKLFIFLASAIFTGYDVILEGIKNIFHLNFEESTLMTIAIIAAFALGDYAESVAIIILFKLGEFIENKATKKANQNINGIASLQVKTANVIVGKQTKVVEAEKVMPGMKILVKAGETVPVDCIVLDGKSEINTASLTGESEPVEVNKGKEILSGTINLTGALECEAIRTYENSAISKIVDLVYEATNNKGKKEEYITKFSKIYTPIVIVMAVLLAVIPPILGYNFATWLNRALVFLVASCPCSIVISIPLAYFSCIGSISKKGMLIKGTKHIENLAKADILAMDKTGTITTGKMQVKEVKAFGISEKEVIEYAYSLEKNSNHPISNAIIKYAEENKIEYSKVEAEEEIAGFGICGKVNGFKIIMGNRKLLEQNKIEIQKEIPENAIVLAKDNAVIGYIILEESVRKGFKETVEKLKNIGIKKIVMLTGDSKKNAEKIAKKCEGIEYKAKLLPEDKVNEVNKLKETGKVVFVGDGINDSPVLATADFGIAMGEGTEIASSSADSILISNNIFTLPEIIKIARKTMIIVNENIAISLLAKAIVLVLGVMGFAPVWLAVAADTGITLLTVLNSTRIF